MDFIRASFCIIVGVFVLSLIIKDENHKKATFSFGYISHIRGYIVSIGFIILGLIYLVEAIKSLLR